MGDTPWSVPDEETIFDCDQELRILALAIETVVQDVSPVGDEETADRLGGFMLGEESPPADAPEYVELANGHLELSNPPFLLAEVTLEENDQYELTLRFDSELDLLIDPPVTVTLEGSIEELVESVEQLLAEIYRTKGRRLEMLDAGVVEPAEFADRR